MKRRSAKLSTKPKDLKGSVKVVEGDEIYSVPADVFIPCALGGIINDETIEHLKVKAVVGSANNQLLRDETWIILQEHGIFYAPDYIVNAGGLIQVADELYTPNKARVLAKTRAIYEYAYGNLPTIKTNSISTAEAANQFCNNRIDSRRKRNSFFSHDKRPKWNVINSN